MWSREPLGLAVAEEVAGNLRERRASTESAAELSRQACQGARWAFRPLEFQAYQTAVTAAFKGRKAG
jgi:hypothetical protein